jgi:dTDP-4-dehydrorhamnose 3,5-epimerase
MHFKESPIPGAWVIDPSPHIDERGRFMRAWCAEEFAVHGIRYVPVQANMGLSLHAGTIRGLHYQVAPYSEAKLVRCTRGAVFDVLVDLRRESPTFGRWFGVELSADNARMMYVPEMCAHGYQTVQDHSEIYYQTSASYAPAAVRGLRFDDPCIAIEWPLPLTSLSEQDRRWPLLEQLARGEGT